MFFLIPSERKYLINLNNILTIFTVGHRPVIIFSSSISYLFLKSGREKGSVNQIQFLCRWHKFLAHPLLGDIFCFKSMCILSNDEHLTIHTVVLQLHKMFALSVFMVVELIRECVFISCTKVLISKSK